MITFWSWLVCFLGFSVVDADVVWEEKAAVSGGGGGKESLWWWWGRQSRGGGRRERRRGRLVRGAEEMIPFVWVISGSGNGDFGIEGDEVFCFFIFWMQCAF